MSSTFLYKQGKIVMQLCDAFAAVLICHNNKKSFSLSLKCAACEINLYKLYSDREMNIQKKCQRAAAYEWMWLLNNH